MDRNELLKRMADGTLSRRRFSRLLASAGLALVTLPLAGRTTRAEDQAIYFTWTGYDDPGFHPGYVKKHGVSPTPAIFADEEEALQKLRAGFTADVVHPCNNSVDRWREAGVLQAIDTSRLANWPDLFDALKTIEGAQYEGKNYFVPVDWGNTSILYRPDLVDIKEESWTLMWDERYAGKLAMAAAGEETVAIAGIVGKAKDPFDMTDAELAQAKDSLIKQKPLLRFYWDTNTTVEQALQSGELVAATGWNSSAVTLKAQGVPIKFMQPKEGILTYCCGLVLSRDAEHVDQAYDLMDAMTAPEAGKWLIDAQGYGHSNRKTFELVDKKLLEERNLPSDPMALLTNGIMFKRNKRVEEVNTMFEAIKAGL
jgi:spermidine/putrescine transport system substrate-binding protein